MMTLMTNPFFIFKTFFMQVRSGFWAAFFLHLKNGITPVKKRFSRHSSWLRFQSNRVSQTTLESVNFKRFFFLGRKRFISYCEGKCSITVLWGFLILRNGKVYRKIWLELQVGKKIAEKMDDIFAIALSDALRQMDIEEDKMFLILQCQKERLDISLV